MDVSKLSRHKKVSKSEPELNFEGNKKQYKLNRNVLDKMGATINTSDDKERNSLLQEGEALLAVECYTAESLASNSGDEKSIKKASKQLMEEKQKSLALKCNPKRVPQKDRRSRHLVLEKSSGYFVVGKSTTNQPHDSQQTCFYYL